MTSLNGEYQAEGNNTVDILKAEIYTISSLVNYTVVDQAFNNRSESNPYGLALPVNVDAKLPKSFTRGLSPRQVRELRPAIAFHFAEVAFRETLFQSTNKLVLALNGSPQPELNLEPQDMEFLKRGWERFCKILPKYAEIAGTNTAPIPKDPLAFFKRGVNTGVKPMGFAGVIPQLAESLGEDFSNEDLHHINRASPSLPFALAGTNGERVSPIIDSLKIPLPSMYLSFFNPDYFSFEEYRPTKRKLIIKPEVEADKRDALGYWIDDPKANTETFGCPGLRRFKNGTAVGILRTWQVMVAKDIYQQLYPNPQ